MFSIPADVDIRKRWIKFANRKDWQPSSSVVCAKDCIAERYNYVLPSRFQSNRLE